MPKTAKDMMQNAVLNIFAEREEYPEWTTWIERRNQYITNPGNRDIPESILDEEFVFPAEFQNKYVLIVRYQEIVTALNALRDVEYYFRRYPFHGLPITHEQHITYTAEMYLIRVTAFRDRVKKYLIELNKNLPDKKRVDIKTFCDSFKKAFSKEIDIRNEIQHETTLSDLSIIKFSNICAYSEMLGDRRTKEIAYRKLVKEWVAAVKNMVADMEFVLEKTARISVASCQFLNFEER